MIPGRLLFFGFGVHWEPPGVSPDPVGDFAGHAALLHMDPKVPPVAPRVQELGGQILEQPLPTLSPQLVLGIQHCVYIATRWDNLSARSAENPSYHSCWLNESDNKRITRIAASCHRRVFEARVLSSWALVQQGGWCKSF
jgi:hypothetical protein